MWEDQKVVVLDIGGTKMSAGIGTPDGEVHREVTVPTHAEEGGARVLERALALARDRLEAERAAGGNVVGLGVSSMGTTFDDRVEIAPNVPGWAQLSLHAAFQEAFSPLPFVIDNDVKAATLAELAWGALAHVDDGLYLNFGTGIAAGIVVAGTLVRGAHQSAGEIGYLLPRGRIEPFMARDNVPPFESEFGGGGVAKRLSSRLGRPIDMANLVAGAATDPQMKAFVDEIWDALAAMTANLCVTLDPAVIALGGGYLRGNSDLRERIETVLAAAVPYPPFVTTAAFGADASLRGAIVVGFGGLQEIKAARLS